MEARANPAQAASATSGSETPGAAPRRGGRFRGRGPDRDFDPRPLREAMIPLLREIDDLASDLPEPLPSEVLDPILRRHPRPGGGYFSRSELIAGQRAFAAEAGLLLDAARFRRRVQRRPVRSQSGVTPLTVLTKPFPCPGQCIFCPNDVRMPKSYLSDEPGAQRAAQNRFDPYLQTWNRLAAFDATGHPIDKVELIVLGGTWSFYPEAYQIDFVRRCLEAMSDYGEGLDRRAEPRPRIPDFEAIDARVDGAGFTKNPYNARVVDFLRRHADDPLLESAGSAESSDWASLERAQRRNESAGSRCVGLVLETRPDHVTEAEILRLRRLGATKVQLGVQQLDDAILAANRRGHDVAATRRAFRLLREAGFKIHAHWMANLLGATPESDARDFARLFDDPDFRPDELKLYPCSLIETAELMRHWQSGAWRPYAEKELLDVVAGALARVPRYCRVTRVIRDISSDDIVVGNKRTNFRQIAEAEVARRGATLCEIRAREIRGGAFETAALRVVATQYAASGGRQVFLELVTPADRIVGFLRLSLPDAPACIDELGRSAIVRELHVYGGSVALGDDAKGRAQHRGLGARLLDEAARIARAEGHASLAVISAIGTRAYYRRQGFVDGTLYQHRALAAERTDPRAPRAATQSANFKRLQARLRGLVGKAIADYGMIAPGDRVMVCLSGGKDSYTLLDLLLSQQRAAPVDFEIVAVNLDQKQPGFPEHVLPEYLRALGVPFHILEQDTYSVVQRVVPAGKTQCGLCSRLRRGALYRFARENGVDKIALGHHRDDIVETLFLNLFHAGRLKAMPPKLLSDDGQNVVIRPLCYVPEREIARYARARAFPIIPCTLCGSQPNLQRKAIAAMLAEWERADPGRIDTIFHALRNVHVSQLADPAAFDFAALVREAGDGARLDRPEAGQGGVDAGLGRDRDAAAERDDAIAEALITGTVPLEDARERVTLWPD